MTSFKSENKILSEGDQFVSVSGGVVPLAEIRPQIFILFCFDGSGNNLIFKSF